MNLRRSVQFKRLSIQFLSTEQTKPTSKIAKKETEIHQTPNKKMVNFFIKDANVQKVLEKVPPKYIQISKKRSESSYLICPMTAKTIADKILPLLSFETAGIISESYPGPALITQELLERGVNEIRLYESSCEFQSHLKELEAAYPQRVKVYDKNIFYLPRYAYLDKRDHGKRVESLLADVPVKPWGGDPAMTIIGGTRSLSFFKHLMWTIALQTGLVTHGRVQTFILMLPKDYAVLSATRQNNLKAYQKWTILFNLFFDHQLLGKFPKEVIVPWLATPKSKYQIYLRNVDPGQIYLIEATMKKELPVPVDQLIHLYYFVRNLYGSGNKPVIPTLEKWVPNSGLNILFPSLQHEDYYPEFDIYTLFRDLTPQQVLGVYREITNSKSYSESPFFDLMEIELMRAETNETSEDDLNLDKHIEQDIDKIVEDELEKE